MVELIGLAAFPLAYFLLPRLADRGFGLSKALGILFIGYASWILSTLHVLPSVQASLVGLLAAMIAVSCWLAYRGREALIEFARQNWRLLAATEIVFLITFLGWTLFRMYDPAIDHTEQPMDFAFLNASVRSVFGQPEDPWLRGESVSYYYFGYWMMGAISELSGVASNFAYNLALALIPALAAAGMLSLVVTMIRGEGAPLRLSVASGIAAGVMLGVVANLEGVLEFMRANSIGSQGLYDWIAIDGLSGPQETPTENWAPDEFWWWFRASRVINTFQDGAGIDYTISEFPFFSFMLGDLHPHVSAIPFALLFAGLALNFFRSTMPDIQRLHLWDYATVGVMAISLGGLAFTNMWDLPTYATLLIAVSALRAYAEPADLKETAGARSGVLMRTGLAVLRVPLLVVALAIILYLPYYLGFASSLEGIGAVVTPTRYVHMFIVWGVPLTLVAPFVIWSFCQTVVGQDWRRMTVISLLVAFLPYVAWMVVRLQSPTPIDDSIGRLVHILPLGLLIAMATWSAIHEIKTVGATGKAFALTLAALAMLLIIGPELLYIDDFFDAPSTRMNTVFKLYYQAWVLLAVCAGFSIYFWLASRTALTGWRRSLSTLWAIGAIVLVVGSLYYPAAASVSKANNFASNATLDGLAFVRTSRPAEYEAIRFIRDNLSDDDAIIEAVGEWFDHGLISRSTGVPTLFNWPGHELQWRGALDRWGDRGGEVATIYTSTDPVEVQNLLAEYDVNYIYVGPREQLQYPGPGLDKFGEFMDVVFQLEDVTIYKTRQ